MSNSILISSTANFYGFESIDASGQHHHHPFTIRGNGKIILTEKEVIFNQWFPSREYRIPISKIVNTELKSWHNLKCKWPRKVLRIFYRENNKIMIFGASVGAKPSIFNAWDSEGEWWMYKIAELKRKEKELKMP